MRKTHTGLAGVTADCKTCGWNAQTRNALGLAAQHADRTGHEVHVEQTTIIIYNKAEA